MTDPYEPKVKKDELIHGAYYRGRCRNAQIARWDGTRQLFIHWRTKFGQRFLEEIECPEDEKVFDVFVAREQLPRIAIDKDEVIPFPEDAI